MVSNGILNIAVFEYVTMPTTQQRLKLKPQLKANSFVSAG